MRRWWLSGILIGLFGCQSNPTVAPSDAALFAPAAMRLHPIFTHLKDWTGNDKPDGIEADIELQDQFGDPTKASGQVIFELYAFQKHDPTNRGARLVNPWVGDLTTLEAQRDRWNRTSRTYSFELAYPQISENRSYVLAATFKLADGKRYFNQLVLEQKPATQPSTEPATEPATEPSTMPTSAPTSAPTSGPVVLPISMGSSGR